MQSPTNWLLCGECSHKFSWIWIYAIMSFLLMLALHLNRFALRAGQCNRHILKLLRHMYASILTIPNVPQQIYWRVWRNKILLKQNHLTEVFTDFPSQKGISIHPNRKLQLTLSNNLSMHHIWFVRIRKSTIFALQMNLLVCFSTLFIDIIIKHKQFN